MSKNYIFTLNDHEFTIQVNLKLANKLGDKISGELFNSGKYYIQSQVSRENFQIFLDFLNEKIEYPEIDVNNYYDYYLLNDEFNKILSNHLKKPEFDQIKHLSILLKATTKQVSDRSSSEEYIAQHLDYFLENHEQEMAKISNTSLYNIFRHKKRILDNQERAYQFIKNILSKSENDNDNDTTENRKDACILLQTLDASQISEESFKESLVKKDENFGFSPKLNFSFVTSFNETVSGLKIQMDELMKNQMKIITEMKSIFDEKLNSFIEKSEETKSEVKSLSEKLDKIEKEVDKISKSNNETKEKVQQIITENTENKNEVKNISNDVKSIETDVQKILTKSGENQNKINEISEKVRVLQNSTSEIGRKCDDTQNSVQKIPAKFDEIAKQTKQIFDTVRESMSITLASIGSSRGIIHELTEECGGNVSDKGIVNVTSSSCYSNHHAKYAVDLDDAQSYFESNYEQNAWLKYDFKNKKVSPFCYLIRSSPHEKGDKHLMNWCIEGSNSNLDNDWTVLDSRNNITSLDNKSVVQVFSIQKTGGFYRYLRIRQTGNNSGNCTDLRISSLEYFGSIQ